jgi:hypothetical protein
MARPDNRKYPEQLAIRQVFGKSMGAAAKRTETRCIPSHGRPPPKSPQFTWTISRQRHNVDRDASAGRVSNASRVPNVRQIRAETIETRDVISSTCAARAA